MLMAYGFAVGPTREVVIAGEVDDERTQEILGAIHRAFVPDKVVLLRPAVGSEELIELAPFVEAQGVMDGKPTIYVCENFTCQKPTHDLAEVLEALEVE